MKKMNSEECRLRSFEMWSNSPICVRMLSDSGFYATGNLFEVECNWCHARISDWKCNENLHQRHSRLSPRCAFVINRHLSGNIPLSTGSDVLLQPDCLQDENINEDYSAEKGNRSVDLLIEQDRLATFRNWPNPNISPQSLAKAGFFYRNRSDEVECAWCKGVIAQWEKQDNAFEEHRRFFPQCPRVQLGPLIEIANDEIRDLGIQHISPPKNLKYTSVYTRLQTYSNWPIPDIQKPENLAQAGLYYLEVDDQVRCFHCNMGLRSWEKEDDPWFEHAKWYPMCEFVRLVKGVHYIEEVQELTRNAQTPMTIDEAMLSEPVKLALEMGVNIDTLRYKIHQKLYETGRLYETADDLFQALFDDQENTNIPQSSTGSRQFGNLKRSMVVNKNITSSTNTDPLTTTPTTAQNINIKKTPENENNSKINQKENLTLSETNGKFPPDRKFLEEENRKLKDARLCKVCLDEEVGVVYLPCGHLVTCVQCAPGVNQCPMCRTKIKGFVRTYLS